MAKKNRLLGDGTKHTRTGQSLFTMWLGDKEREKWEQVRKANNKTSLAKFVKDVVNEYIVKYEMKGAQSEEIETIRKELKETNAAMSETLAKIVEGMKQPLKIAAAPIIKSQVLALLESLKRPAQWEEIVKITGSEKEAVLVALQELFEQKLITMTKTGEWILNG